MHLRLFCALFALFIALVSGSTIDDLSRESHTTEAQLEPVGNNISEDRKIPLYLGSSYDLLIGNPKSEYGLDPGFYHPIFIYTYKQNKKTEDDKFLIPDQASSHKMSTCSFATDVSTFRGSKSYQSDLKTSADVSAGGKFFATFSFSMSASYEKMENTTSKEKQTVTHASAECEVYELIIDKFTPPNLTENFIQGALYSYKTSNWTEFLEEFGTHYAHEVIMGGRATQQTTYSFKSVSMLQSLGVDVNVAAKASYASFFGDASFDYKKYSKQMSYSESMSNEKKYMYVGGQPPRNGDIYEWQKNIIDDPMPIKYKLFLLSELFKKITVKGFNVSIAEKQFEQALAEYCDRKHCRPPSDDFPKPTDAKLSVQQSPLKGGGGGHSGAVFNSYFNSTSFDLQRVIVRNQTYVKGLQLLLTDGITSEYTTLAGGTQGNVLTWDVPEKEHIVQIEYRSGWYVDSITFITNMGKKSPKFGSSESGDYSMVTFPADYRIIGMYGEHTQGSNGLLVKLGFVLGKTIFPETPRSEEFVDYKYIELE